MPTYEYRCQSCGHQFEEFQSITARPLKKCPSCAKSALKRLISGGAGIIFKGSGFYETDYRSDSYKKAAKAEQDAAKPVSAETKSDTAKSETKTESSPTSTDKKPADKPKKDSSSTSAV